MSRSGYIDDINDIDDNLQLGRWRGIVASTIRGKRGQALLKEMAEAMDAMSVKELITSELVKDGAVCALGSVATKRGMDVSNVDPHDPPSVAHAFGVTEPLVREIAFMNDEAGYYETPAQRWTRMRKWIDVHIEKPKST